mgnify:FL=1
MAKTIFEEMGGTYVRKGDYDLPCLSLSPEKENKPIGVWGQRHLRYIRQHKRVLYTTLLTSGKLNSYLANIDEQAEDLFFRLVEQMAEREGVTEQLKAENQMEWVGRINNIRSRAMEIVYSTIIYGFQGANLYFDHFELNGSKDIPKIFWKYYDLYRRHKITLSQYSESSGLQTWEIKNYLKAIEEEQRKFIENPKQI